VYDTRKKKLLKQKEKMPTQIKYRCYA